MPIPFLFGAASLLASAVGFTMSVEGVKKINEAKEISERVQKQYKEALTQLEVDIETTNQLAQEYGRLQLDFNRFTIKRFVALLRRTGQRASKSEQRILNQLNISGAQFKRYNAAVLEAEQLFECGTTAALAGAATAQGAVTLVGFFGTASTGTAIAGLSGAAASNATLAWFGGGSLAAGGGGMALGTLVIGGIVVGSALAVGGFMLAGEGDEALKKAQEYEAKVKTEIAEIDVSQKFLGQVRQRIADLSTLVNDLNGRAIEIIGFLESQASYEDRNTEKLQHVTLLIKAIEKIQKTPVLNRKGKLNPVTANLLAPGLMKRIEEEQRRDKIIIQAGKLLGALVVFGSVSWIAKTIADSEHIKSKQIQHQVQVTETSNSFVFPQASCGDKPTGSNDTWYPVFIDGGNLEKIRHQYCADAVTAVRENTGTSSVQVASFNNLNRALDLAKIVGGTIGKPTYPEQKNAMQKNEKL